MLELLQKGIVSLKSNKIINTYKTVYNLDRYQVSIALSQNSWILRHTIQILIHKSEDVKHSRIITTGSLVFCSKKTSEGKDRYCEVTMCVKLTKFPFCWSSEISPLP